MPALSSSAGSEMKNLQPQPLWKMICYASYQTGCDLSLSYVCNILIPNQVIDLVGNEYKSITLGLVLVISAFFSLISGPVFGYVSDKLVKFQVFIILIAATIWSATIVGRVPLVKHFDIKTQPFWFWAMLFGYTGFVTLSKLFYTLSLTPYIALMPRIFPKTQYGTVSGVVSFASLIGTMTGVAVLGSIYHLLSEFWISLIASILIVMTVLPLVVFIGARKAASDARELASKYQPIEEVSIASAEEQEGSNIQDPVGYHMATDENQIGDAIKEQYHDEEASVKSSTNIFYRIWMNSIYPFVKPFKHRNFALVCLGTFLTRMATESFTQFFLYLIQDMVHPNYTILVWKFIETPEQAQGACMVAVFLTGVITATISGILSDKLKRKKRMIVISGILINATSCVVIVANTRYFGYMLIASVFYGIGIGIILTMILSLANEVLPDPEEAAKDLALWNVCVTSPQLFASPLGGVIIYFGQQFARARQIYIRGFGYILLVGIVAVLQIAAAIAFFFVKTGASSESKKRKRRSSRTIP